MRNIFFIFVFSENTNPRNIDGNNAAVGWVATEFFGVLFETAILVVSDEHAWSFDLWPAEARQQLFWNPVPFLHALLFPM